VWLWIAGIRQGSHGSNLSREVASRVEKANDEKRQDRRFSPFELNQTTGTILAAIRRGCLCAMAETSAALIQVLATCGDFDKPVINRSAML
jgi:hypothetical protein